MLIVLVVVVVLLAVGTADDWTERCVALVAFGMIAGYLITPGSGYGLPGKPVLFGLSLRYSHPRWPRAWWSGPSAEFGRSAVVSYRWRWLSWASWRRPDIASWR